MKAPNIPMASLFRVLIAILASLVAQTATASPYDCLLHIREAERRYGIPNNLLLAVALTESGRGSLPNPWALNIHGKSYQLDSRESAESQIRRAINRGQQSIDIGCMQINLAYHGDKFGAIDRMLDVRHNVHYGAYYLASQAARHGNWQEGIMSYHNKNNPARRRWYYCNVMRNYARLNNQPVPSSCGPAPKGSSVAAISQHQPTGVLRAQSNGTRIIPSTTIHPRGRMTLTIDTESGPRTIIGQSDSRSNALVPIRPVNWARRINEPTDQRPAAEGFTGRITRTTTQILPSME